MNITELKKSIEGTWKSIAPEVRPSISKNADGSAKPFYLTRTFKYLDNDHFELEIINFADAYGKLPMVKLQLKGHVAWVGEHPVAEGAQKVNFTADEAYEVTPLIQGFTDVLNQLASENYQQWTIHETKSILGKAFLPFGLKKGQFFAEYDLMYFLDGMLFWGARHVDGRGFNTEENRPDHLQIPMIKA